MATNCKEENRQWQKQKRKMEANPFKLKKELPHLPGYIIVILWTAFIFCMIGWIILASLSTTKEIFTGGLLCERTAFLKTTLRHFLRIKRL